MAAKFPTYFISHGGGPWPYLKEEMKDTYSLLEASLKAIPRDLPAIPRAILMISGHWESKDFAVMSSPMPPMLYDYSGFPAHTYQVKYPAPGFPELALQVQSRLQAAGLPTRLDSARGFDHGSFVPMAVTYPNAEIPMIQISIHASYYPEIHLKLGRALSPLREQGVLIVGSGLSYHNLRSFGGPAAKKASAEFDHWLNEVLVEAPNEQRSSQLKLWEQAPSARFAHPQADHLIPLLVAVGAAEHEKATRVYHETHFFGGLTVSSYRFGE